MDTKEKDAIKALIFFVIFVLAAFVGDILLQYSGGPP